MTQLPLEGIRVVDGSRVLAGPFATMLLADLGADVIKVEPPDGDESRAWGPPWWGEAADRRSAYFASVNRNKRSVVLDLRSEGGRHDLDRLLATADILVHNYLPASAARLGLEAHALHTRHPDLIVATVAGFPGADADRPAYDLLAQAMTGLMAITGDWGSGCSACQRRACPPSDVPSGNRQSTMSPSEPVPLWQMPRRARCARGLPDRLERETGIEPATCSLEGCRSAN